jgi:2-keto-4-pentenoate hydratase/2-oxohepta-3-ene-1,7-dioic acid hydratase in catechol pathway
LTVVLRNSIKDIKPEEAAQHILGYTVGNDVTARFFQRACGGQYTYAKGFDRFAPLGPRLVRPGLVDTSANGGITTKVNGRVVQNSPFDFIFPIDEVLSFLSQGTTVPAGTAILTGTPAGVGWFQDPKTSLQDGDVVEVEVKPIGVLKNTIVYQK